MNCIDKNIISVKRVHGLGNLIFLLPVLDNFSYHGYNVEIYTNTEWHDFIAAVRPNYLLLHEKLAHTIDLDDATKNMSPQKHRTLDFGELLGSNFPSNRFILTIPKRFLSENICAFTNYVLIAPEAGHKARQWSKQYIKEVCKKLTFQYNRKIIIVGKENTDSFPCFLDLRQKLSILDLTSLIYFSDVVVSMDSGVLHLANAFQKATVAIFSGINPTYRILDFHKSIVLQANLECCPCNKNEICNGNYKCLEKIKPSNIIEAIDKSNKIQCRTIWRI